MPTTLVAESVVERAPDPELELIHHAIALQTILGKLPDHEEGAEETEQDALKRVLPEMIVSIADTALGLSRKKLTPEQVAEQLAWDHWKYRKYTINTETGEKTTGVFFSFIGAAGLPKHHFQKLFLRMREHHKNDIADIEYERSTENNN